MIVLPFLARKPNKELEMIRDFQPCRSRGDRTQDLTLSSNTLTTDFICWLICPRELMEMCQISKLDFFSSKFSRSVFVLRKKNLNLVKMSKICLQIVHQVNTIFWLVEKRELYHVTWQLTEVNDFFTIKVRGMAGLDMVQKKNYINYVYVKLFMVLHESRKGTILAREFVIF